MARVEGGASRSSAGDSIEALRLRERLVSRSQAFKLMRFDRGPDLCYPDRMRHLRPSPWIWLCLAWLLALASGGAARADAVPPPPDDCPPGAIGETGHNGPYCTPKACASDAECTDRRGYDKRPRTCAPLAMCVEIRKEPSASGWSHGTPITRRFAHEACDDDGACRVGSCERGHYCVLAADAPPERPATTPAGTVAKGCGACDAGGADAATWLAIAAGLVVRTRFKFRRRPGTPRPSIAPA